MVNYNIIFVLPGSLTLSGVTTWSVEMCRRLTATQRVVPLIKHVSAYSDIDITLPPQVSIIECPNPVYPGSLHLTERDVALGYLPAYQSHLPGIIIPNWSHGTYAACALITKTQASNIRTIGYAHADDPEYYNWLTYYEPIIHRFVAVSQEIGEQLAALIPHRQADIVVKPYAVNTPKQLKRRYSTRPEPLQLVYAGRISEHQKRVSDLVRLAEILSRNQVNFQLRIIGEGADKDVLRQKIASLEPSTRQRITFEAGLSPDQMPAVWQAADIFLLVSAFEGTSIAMLEAMAQGCVPVVTEVSGAKAVIQGGQNGFMVPVNALEEMGQMIGQLDTDRTRLCEIGHQAHQTVAARYDYDDYMAWFLNMADEVWREAPRPWPANRPLLPHKRSGPELPELYRNVVSNLSGQDIARYVPLSRIIQGLGFKLANQPGFGWLYRFRSLGKKIVGD
ncbi:MAG: glycosyltransferase family 4 protein [Anaerolineae bacterium]|nr:glycosyltransferase family 4 protein [Anaerolineae bacterium]